MRSRRLGIALVWAMAFSTVALWALAKQAGAGLAFALSGKALALSLGQLAGLLAAACIVLDCLLASRAGFLERWFGGLDRVYRLHRTLGVGAFVLMLYHPLFLALQVLPNYSAALRYFLPTGNTAYTLGISALALFIGLVLLTLFPRLPYHLWKRTHMLMGIPLTLVILHSFLVPSDIRRFWPLMVWMGALFALALGAAVFRRFLYARWGPRHDYAVMGVRRLADITEVTFLPIGEPLAFTPGQFVFVSFLSARVSGEKHPFSVSSRPGEPFLRLSIKSLGDWTETLSLLAPGNEALVYGPYGAFGEVAARSDRDQIWIAGGIGITPFLSLAADRTVAGRTGRVHLFYCTRDRREAVYLPELEEASGRTPELRVVHHRSADDGRLTCDLIETAAGGLEGKLILLCGPTAMTHDLVAQFERRRVRAKNIVFEDFSFMT